MNRCLVLINVLITCFTRRAVHAVLFQDEYQNISSDIKNSSRSVGNLSSDAFNKAAKGIGKKRIPYILRSIDYSPLVDLLESDDYGDEEQIDKYAKASQDNQSAAVSSSELDESRLRHNIYRSNQTGVIPEIMDMEYMEVSKDLHSFAQELADSCQWRTRTRMRQNVTRHYLLQNVYFGPSRDLAWAEYLWYQEYLYFNFSSMNCTVPPSEPNASCSHFLAMMWSSSYLMGCGRQLCHPRSVKYFITCIYAVPLSHIFSQKPFHYGKACNSCPRYETGYCWKNLCVDKQTCANQSQCICNQQCKNCGELDKKECICNCRNGWDGQNCGTPCNDSHSFCKFLPRKKCEAKYDGQIAIKSNLCRSRCSMCQKAYPQESDLLCCAGKICPTGYEINKLNCNCELSCPGILCPYGSVVAESLLESSVTIPPILEAASNSQEFHDIIQIVRTLGFVICYRVALLILCE